MDYIIDSVTDEPGHGVQRSWEKFEEFCKSYHYRFTSKTIDSLAIDYDHSTVTGSSTALLSVDFVNHNFHWLVVKLS
jgi:hypothetical protein